MTVRLSLPYYELRLWRRGVRREARVHLEAYLSRWAGPSEICLLTAPPLAGLSSEPGPGQVDPWAGPQALLEHFLRVSSVLEEAATSQRVGGRWFIRRLIQELNRLVVGGLAGRPVEPEVDREKLRAGLARQLCRDALWSRARGARIVEARLLWYRISVEESGGRVEVYEESGRRARIIESLAERNPTIRRALLAAGEALG